MGLGLSVEQTCQLAYEFAVINKIEMPKNWKNNECGGREWFRCFLRRHPNLSIRKPEACSVARASSFNKTNMDSFFNRLEGVLARHPSFQDGSRIVNLDECGTTTVSCLGKIVAPKGQKQVYQSTSGERGTLVTTCLIVGALGQVIPPVMLFPRKNFKNNMTIGAYPGTLGLACESGWMNAELFPKVLQHIVKHTACTKENPLLILCDNLEAHVTLEAIEYARENGITILTLVPHTTHRTQPLDVSIMGPFKRAYENAMSIWKRAHPNQCCTIYDLAQFVCSAVGKALTPANITAGFKKTGIMPFDRTVFKELDFIPSRITDRPNPEASEDINSNVLVTEEDNSNTQSAQARPSANVSNTTLSTPGSVSTGTEGETIDSTLKTPDSERPLSAHSNKSGTSSVIGPEVFRGIPTPAPRKRTNKERQKGKSMIATDTPEKNEIKRKAEERAKKTNGKKKKESQPPPKKSRRALKFKQQDSCSEESNPDEPDEPLTVSSEGEWEGDMMEENSPLETGKFPPLTSDPKEEDFILVEFKPKSKNQTPDYYVAKVLKEKDEDNDLEVSYLRKSTKVLDKFVIPPVPDLASVHIDDVKYLLPKPTCTGTRRQQNLLSFDVDFSLIRVL